MPCGVRCAVQRDHAHGEVAVGQDADDHAGEGGRLFGHHQAAGVMLPNQLRGLGHLHGRIGNDDRADADVASGEAPRFLDLPGALQSGSRTSAATQQSIDDAVRAIVMEAFARITTLLEQRREVLERCAKALLERETLDEAALKALIGPA